MAIIDLIRQRMNETSDRFKRALRNRESGGLVAKATMSSTVDRREFSGGIVGVIQEPVGLEAIRADFEKAKNYEHDGMVVIATRHVEALLAEVERLHSIVDAIPEGASHIRRRGEVIEISTGALAPPWLPE